MKITTNFTTPVGQSTPYLVVLLSLLMGTAIVATIALFLSARNFSSEALLLEEDLVRFRNREIPSSTDLMTYEQLVKLRNRVRELNEITDTSGQSLPVLFSRLETLMLDGVWLANLQYRSRDNEIKLVAEANQPEQLSRFMEKLERSGYFSQVLLTRQMQGMEGARGDIQFEIQLKGKL